MSINPAKWFSLVALVLGCVLLAPRARAQEAGGVSADAMPGLDRVRVAQPFRLGITGAASLGYGFTESVIAEADQHHSAMNSLGVSYAPLAWLSLGAGVNSRFDLHRRGSDTTFAGVPSLQLRGITSLGEDWNVGAQLRTWFPSLQSASLDGLFVASKKLAPGLSYHLNTGFRFDRSAKALDNDGFDLMRTDLLTLGTSDSHAVLLGAGIDYQIGGETQVFGEWSYDLLVGDDAPDFEESPMRLGFGVRRAISDSMQVSISLEANISRVAPVDARLSLVPVEPIASMTFSISRRPVLPPAPLVPYPPATGRIEGIVLSQDDKPIEGASVNVGEQKVATSHDGHFLLVGLKPGPVAVMITAKGHVISPLHADVTSGGVVRLPVVAIAEGTPGQIRFVVISPKGGSLVANVTVMPGDHQLETSSDGLARLELAPGEYQVSVQAPGHSPQERNVIVDAFGVTILNLALMTERVQN